MILAVSPERNGHSALRPRDLPVGAVAAAIANAVEPIVASPNATRLAATGALPPPGLRLALGFLVAILAGGIGLIVSLRASTAQEAQQLTGIGMVVPLMLASFLLVAADRRFRVGRLLALLSLERCPPTRFLFRRARGPPGAPMP